MNLFSTLFRCLLLISFVFALVGCASRSVERISSSEVRDLSGNWNDTDSQLVAQDMVKDLLARPWIARFQGLSIDANPAVVVGRVQNLTHEHINTMTFINDLERELVNSGRVDFVSGAEIREILRTERAEQDIFASEATRKEMGQEIGADFMLFGTLNSIFDVDGRDSVKFYQIDLKLIEIETNRIAWVGQKKIKKFVEEGFFR